MYKEIQAKETPDAPEVKDAPDPLEQRQIDDVKIAEAEKNLVQLKEYKTKLLGGLETLELLAPKTEETQGGVPEPSTVPPSEATPSDNTVSSETGV